MKTSKKANVRAVASITLALSLAALIVLSIPRPLRLHIIANSDSTQDQQIKLLVRDALLNEMQGDLSAVNTKMQARKTLLNNGERLQTTAENTLKEAGVDYGVHIMLGYSTFPDRTYGTTNYPAGEYEALRVVLGDGAGRNWWCVMYPPLCIGKLKPTGTVKFKSALLTLFNKGRLPT